MNIIHTTKTFAVQLIEHLYINSQTQAFHQCKTKTAICYEKWKKQRKDKNHELQQRKLKKKRATERTEQ